jgi:hypothetical protein
MARIAGVKMQNDEKGRPASITINLKKHPQAVGPLQNLGLLEKSPLQNEIDENPDNYGTVDEVFDRLEQTIKGWKWAL